MVLGGGAELPLSAAISSYLKILKLYQRWYQRWYSRYSTNVRWYTNILISKRLTSALDPAVTLLEHVALVGL